MSDTTTSAARRAARSLWRYIEARRALRLVLGLILLVIGLVGLLMPILPGWLLIFVGLAVLGVKLPFLERIKDWARRKAAEKRT